MAFQFPGIEANQPTEPSRKQQDAQAHAWAKHYLTNPTAYATTMLSCATRIMSLDELADLEPKTIRLELRDHYRVAILPDNFDRLMALVVAISTDLFYQSLPAFIEVCNILGGTPPDADVFDPADVYEMAWGITEVKMVDKDADVDFSIDIRKYIGQMLYEEGFISPPALLAVADMPPLPSPAELGFDAELTTSVIQADQERHADVESVVKENLTNMLRQVQQITGPIDDQS